MKNKIRTFSIISYLLIILAGDMIGIPFILWLFFVSLDFGNIDQLFALLGIIGVGLNLSSWNSKIPVTILSFIFMLSPLISRILQVGVEKFNYLAFEIPFSLFILTYLIFVVANIRDKKTITKHI